MEFNIQLISERTNPFNGAIVREYKLSAKDGSSITIERGAESIVLSQLVFSVSSKGGIT